MPGAKHICPNSAACWSPAMPAMGTLAEPERGRDLAVDLAGGAHLRQHARGTSEAARSSSSSHCSVWMLNSMVREALLTSVTWTRAAGQLPDQPAVDGAEGQLAGFGLSRAPGTLSRIQRELGAGEVGVDHQAGSPGSSASCPALRAGRRSRRCGGPARRWRCRSACRSRGPRRWSSRAGW